MTPSDSPEAWTATPDRNATNTPPDPGTEPATRGRGKPPRQPPASRRVWLIAGAVGLLAAVLGYLVIPNSGGAAFELRGDPNLADDVEHAMDGREGLVQGMVVLRRDDAGEPEVVSGGTKDGQTQPDPDTLFETGSIFKVFTAMTLADMVEGGETDLDRTLGEIFPGTDFADAGVADVTLRELATHTSGLAEMPAEGVAPAMYASMVALDAFRQLPDPVESLATTHLVEPGESLYSNFGYAVLGAALARESGTDYHDLVRERVLDPLGMDDTHILGGDIDTVPADAAAPHVERGAPATTWAASDYAPAGVGTWATANDLMRFVTAVQDESAPGLSSVEQVWADDDLGFGHGLGWWIIPTSDGEDVLGHGGTTNGSMAFMGLRGDTAVVALSNSFMVDMSPVAASAFGIDEVPPALQGLPTNMPLLVTQTLLMALVPAVLALTLMLRRTTLIGQRRLDRLRVISMPLGATAMLLVALRVGSWGAVSPVVWCAALGVVLAALAVGVAQWSRTPWVRARFRWLRLTCFGLSATVSLVVATAMVWALGAAYLS